MRYSTLKNKHWWWRHSTHDDVIITSLHYTPFLVSIFTSAKFQPDLTLASAKKVRESQYICQFKYSKINKKSTNNVIMTSLQIVSSDVILHQPTKFQLNWTLANVFLEKSHFWWRHDDITQSWQKQEYLPPVHNLLQKEFQKYLVWFKSYMQKNIKIVKIE